MQHRLRSETAPPVFTNAFGTLPAPEDAFRQRFKASLFYFIRKGLTVEKSFGFVWEQTLEDIHLAEADQKKLYHELILWAKNGAR